MAAPQFPEPVKLFVAVLWADRDVLEPTEAQLAEQWGTFDFAGSDYPFDRTDYYASEMGTTLFRRLVSFDRLIPPESIRSAKLVCNQIEDRLLGPTGRRVNLDIGYLDHNKIVLASCKSAGQKIHLGDGIYADLVGRYAQGRYQPFPWTFPDFRDGRYDPDLGRIRRLYLDQLKAWRAKRSSAGS